MKDEVPAPHRLRVIVGDGRPYLLVWNEGLLRSPANAIAMAAGHAPRPPCASGLLTLFASRVRQLFPQLAVLQTDHEGCVRVESRRGADLSAARDLAFDMGLSLLEPGRTVRASVFRPTPRVCRALIQMLHDRACDLVELSYDDVELTVSCADDDVFVVVARSEERRAANTISSLGFMPLRVGCYLTVLGWSREWSATLLFRQLTELQGSSASLAVTLHVPRPRRAR